MIYPTPANKCYMIAEIGGNFVNCDQAKQLIDAAVYCGVDAVKLQTYRAETVASKEAVFDMENTGKVSQYDLFKKYEISEEVHSKIFAYASMKGISCFSTPSHESDVVLLEKFGVTTHKIGSDDAVNLPFLRYVASTGKHIILSTGMCTLLEVQESVNAILETGNDKISILHAVTSYPTHPQDANLSAIRTLKRTFPEFIIGYSDHTVGTTACLCAVAMGAQIIEKHFTLDKDAEGPDHMLSSDPDEMAQLIKSIREFESMRGSGIKMPTRGELNTRLNNRKSIVLLMDVDAGEVLTSRKISIKRPGTGIAPKHFENILGRRVSRKIAADSVLKWGDLL